MISLYFTVADYISGKHNQFAYKLEGLDLDWVYTDNNKRSASYSNLEPGNYSFKVKASVNPVTLATLFKVTSVSSFKVIPFMLL